MSENEKLILTKLRIINPDGAEHVVEHELVERPGYKQLALIIDPLVDGNLEHVSVLADFAGGDKFTHLDMFVNDVGVLDGLPRNEAATTIYRRNWMLAHPKDNPDDLPHIAGTAVLLDRRVWF